MFAKQNTAKESHDVATTDYKKQQKSGSSISNNA
jgi:hypothetical protein